MEPLRIEVQALNAQALSSLKAVETQAGMTAAAATGLDASMARASARGSAALLPLNQQIYASSTALNAMAAAEAEVAAAAQAATASILPLNQAIYGTNAAAATSIAAMSSVGTSSAASSKVITAAMASTSGGLLVANEAAVKTASAFTGLLAAAGGFVAFSAITSTFNRLQQSLAQTIAETLSLGKELDTLSSKTGIGTDALGALRFAADQSEVGFETLAMGIKFLQINMVEAAGDPASQAAKAFETLGVSVLDASGQVRKAEEVLPSIAQGMTNLANDADRTALSVEIFGRAGASLIPMWEGGARGLTDLTAKAKELGVILDPELVAKAARADDTFAALSMRWKVLKSEAIEPLLDPMNQMAEDLLILQKHAEMMDAKAIENFNKKSLYSFAPYPDLLSAIGIQFDSVHDKALKAAEAIRKAGDEMVNTSRMGEFRLSEQSPYDVPRKPSPTVKVKTDAEEVQSAVDRMNEQFRENRMPGFMYEAGRAEGANLDRDRASAAERRRLAEESAREADAFVYSLIPAAEKMKDVKVAAGDQVTVMTALDNVFNDLAKAAEYANDRTTALIASLGSMAIEIIKLIQAMSAGPGAKGGVTNGFLQLFDLAGGVVSGSEGPGNAPSEGFEGPPSPQDLGIQKAEPFDLSPETIRQLNKKGIETARFEIPPEFKTMVEKRGIAARPEITTETIKVLARAPREEQRQYGPFIEAGRTMLSAVEKLGKGAANIVAGGSKIAEAARAGVAPLTETAGAAATGMKGLLGMAGYMAIGIPAVMAVGTLLGTILSKRNEAAYSAYADLNEQLTREKQAGAGPIVSQAMMYGLPRSAALGGGNYPVGYIGTTDDSPWNDAPDPGPGGIEGVDLARASKSLSTSRAWTPSRQRSISPATISCRQCAGRAL